MSKMKPKEMLFDLESHELIDPNQKAESSENEPSDLADPDKPILESKEENKTTSDEIVSESSKKSNHKSNQKNNQKNKKQKQTGGNSEPGSKSDRQNNSNPKNKQNNKQNKISKNKPAEKSSLPEENPRAKNNQGSKQDLSANPSSSTEEEASLENLKENMAKIAGNISETAKPALESLQAKSKDFAKKIKPAMEKTQKSLAKTGQNLKKDMDKSGIKGLLERYKFSLIAGALILAAGLSIYAISFQSLPKLSETHMENSGENYKNFDAEAHPMEILSTVRENMKEFKGDPTEKGDGKTEDTRYVVYSLEWFGMNRKTVLYYDGTNTFYRIKLEVGNESAESLYEKMTKTLGKPMEEKDPTVKEGYAVWIKDAIKYKMMHRGSYTQIDMSIAKYDNTQNLPVGKYPITIQSINNIDLNGDKEINEKILLLGNRPSSTSIAFDKLYLLVWDGQKTYLKEMDPEYDGGSYPQISFKDTDKDGKEEIIISAENNIVVNYNAFKYTGSSLDKVYSGYEEPGHHEQ